MCLAIPGKIESIIEGSDPRMAMVNFGGVRKAVCLECVPEATVNEYVLVHVGLAITTVDEQEAKETIRLYRAMNIFPGASTVGKKG